jgi:ABC-type branched-subunit amino acid transport system ATPase component
MDERVRIGIYVVRTVAAIFPYLNLERNLKLVDHCESSGLAAETSRRMQAGTEASRYRGGPDG